ncbi:MAG: M55 family metallopeptidase, partial [Thermomicrobium sp.]
MVADLEGMSNISRREICFPAHAEYTRALAAYRAEVDALAEAARARGIAAVRLLDWHQRRLPFELFPDVVEPDALLVEQRPRVAVLLGFHARAGQRDAFAACTLIPGLRLFWEDREAGELALASRWLGELGIPLLLVTGDRGLTSEAEEWTDQTATVTVKQALRPDEAESLPPEVAQRALADALQRVLARRSW